MKSDCQMHEHYIRLLCHAGRLQWAIAKPETCPCATACAATNGSAGLKFFLSVGMGVWAGGKAARRRQAGGRGTTAALHPLPMRLPKPQTHLKRSRWP